MTRVLVDTSVLIKWFHADGERDLASSRAIRDAHVAGELDAHILDLALYEVGNVLVRALGWDDREASDQLDDLLTVVGPPLAMAPAWLRRAATLARQHSLSFYDASWAATADELGIPLISADRKLVRTGLAESPGEIANRLRLIA